MSTKASTALNTKEETVFKAFPRENAITISDLAEKAFPKKGVSAATKGNSWVRNSLRKLIRLKLVEHVKVSGKGTKSGSYKRTGKTLAELAAS
jgi:predicted transcriptional regulator